ncbi:MAG: GNAT family N-acetyltransferase [Candidatus Thorarchaeota archaeon]|nr:MAG: GNAT family N-acetyltransferase [Candidatus Thorarchaeota archaeon]
MRDNDSKPTNAAFLTRRAKVADANQISALYKRVWDEYEKLMPRELRESRQPSVDEMREWMKRETYIVAAMGSEVVGVVGCRLMHGTCQLTHMAVDKPHRGLGIGTALVKEVIEFARSKKSHKIWLDTAPFMEEAISIYMKFGFRKSGYMSKHFWGLDIEFYELILTP